MSKKPSAPAPKEKKIHHHIAGFPKAWSEYLESKDYPPQHNGMDVLLAGEDLVHNVMKVSIYDLADWIKAGARVHIMPKEDRKALKNYFRKVDLRKK